MSSLIRDTHDTPPGTYRIYIMAIGRERPPKHPAGETHYWCADCCRPIGKCPPPPTDSELGMLRESVDYHGIPPL